tara:strand:+ start:295 stop:504 length:210 start_codon:yes stop_codon:yes gene_type:complete
VGLWRIAENEVGVILGVVDKGLSRLINSIVSDNAMLRRQRSSKQSGMPNRGFSIGMAIVGVLVMNTLLE